MNVLSVVCVPWKSYILLNEEKENCSLYFFFILKINAISPVKKLGGLWSGIFTLNNNFSKRKPPFHEEGRCRKNQHFLKNWPMTFGAKGKKCTKSRQTNTSHCPTKTISKTGTHPLKNINLFSSIIWSQYIDSWMGQWFPFISSERECYDSYFNGKKINIFEIDQYLSGRLIM